MSFGGERYIISEMSLLVTKVTEHLESRLQANLLERVSGQLDDDSLVKNQTDRKKIFKDISDLNKGMQVLRDQKAKGEKYPSMQPTVYWLGTVMLKSVRGHEKLQDAVTEFMGYVGEPLSKSFGTVSSRQTRRRKPQSNALQQPQRPIAAKGSEACVYTPDEYQRVLERERRTGLALDTFGR